MEVIEYLSCDNKQYWLDQIKKSDWRAGQKLAVLLEENKLKEKTGDSTLVPLLVDGDKLVSFCTYAPVDEVQPTDLHPWIGYVYTFPEYRGHRYVSQLFDWCEATASVMGKENIYISTDAEGLYEKYGFTYLETKTLANGRISRIYTKSLQGNKKQKTIGVTDDTYCKGNISQERIGVTDDTYCKGDKDQEGIGVTNDTYCIGNRIIVLGNSGSGKSTFAKKLHEYTDLPLYHLDNIWWKEDKTNITIDEFDKKLSEILKGDKWIIDGNYSRTYEVRIKACDTIIFLDYSTEVCLKGIKDRVGTMRTDIPWIEESLDFELEEMVKNFRNGKRNVLLELLEKYPNKKLIKFYTREQADEWLNDLKKR